MARNRLEHSALSLTETSAAVDVKCCTFSRLPTELRCSIIGELLSSSNNFQVCTKYIPRPLERTPGRRIIYSTNLSLQVFQIDRRSRREALSLLSKTVNEVDLRYCSAEFVADIDKLLPSALRNALNESVTYAHLGSASFTDFVGFRRLFPRLQRLTLDQLGASIPYGRARTRRTDGFSVNKELVPFMNGDFDVQFGSLARQDISDFLTLHNLDIGSLKLEVPFRFSVPRSSNEIHADLRSSFPGRVLVFAVAHSESETKIASKYFSKFEVKNSRSRPAHAPAVSHVSLGAAQRLSLQNAFSVYGIHGISSDTYESIEIHHWGYCGTGLFHAFDGWLNDRYDFTWRA